MTCGLRTRRGCRLAFTVLSHFLSAILSRGVPPQLFSLPVVQKSLASASCRTNTKAVLSTAQPIGLSRPLPGRKDGLAGSQRNEIICALDFIISCFLRISGEGVCADVGPGCFREPNGSLKCRYFDVTGQVVRGGESHGY